MDKQFQLIILSLVIFLTLFSSFGNAITSSLGNSRMVLRLETGESREEFIRLINRNDHPVNVNLSVIRDLNESIEIILSEESFILEPQESREAYFTITPLKEGTSTNKINALFTYGEEGLGLVATIIVVASSESTEYSSSQSDKEINQNNQQVIYSESKDSNLSGLNILLLISPTLLIILLALLFFSIKKKNQKKEKL